MQTHIVPGGGNQERQAGNMPEWIGTILFFAAIALTATKINEDFGKRGEIGYLMLILMIAIYAGAVGVAYA
jgi:uncharacterized membrane protein YkvI